MTDKDTSDVWWKNVICYAVDVRAFADMDGDGVGDLPGLIDRLGYLRELGVGCLWLLPIHPSPLRDGGYDVTDYYAIDPRIGTLGDFVEMVRTAHGLGMRVLMDLVVSHTSAEHPWFRAARSSPESPMRDFYIWSADRPPDAHPPVFPGDQDSTWTRDERTGEWYFHHYHDFQPDLNVASPKVRDEIHKILGFWLELGVDGFRVDSLPFLIDKPGIAELPEDPHSYLRQLRDFLSRRKGDAVLFGEANLPAREQRAFFGDPDTPHDDSEATILFDFRTQAALWLALAREEAEPLARALRERPEPPESCCYANFARHHDELTFENVLDEAEAADVRAAFDPHGIAEAYGRGLRRRLADLLDDNVERILLVHALTLSLPGMPGLLYGDEVGLGDDLRRRGRMSLRTEMPWALSARQESLHDGVRGLIQARASSPELGYGRFQVLDEEDPAVLVLQSTWRQRRVLVAHNLAGRPATTAVPEGGQITVVGGESTDHQNGRLTLKPYGSIWLRVGERPESISPEQP